MTAARVIAKIAKVTKIGRHASFTDRAPVCESYSRHTLPALRTTAAQQTIARDPRFGNIVALVAANDAHKPFCFGPSRSRHGRSSFWSCGCARRPATAPRSKPHCSPYSSHRRAPSRLKGCGSPGGADRHCKCATNRPHQGTSSPGTTGRDCGPFHDGRVAWRFRASRACQADCGLPSARAVRFQSQPAPARPWPPAPTALPWSVARKGRARTYAPP